MQNILELINQGRYQAIADANVERRLEYQLWSDYYQNDQVANYEQCYMLFNENYNNNNTYGPYTSSKDPTLYDVYGKVGPLVTELMDGNKKGFHNYLRRWPVGLPVTKRVVDTLGCAYDIPPERAITYTIDEALNKKLNEIMNEYLEETLLDNIFMTVDRYSILHGVAGVLIEFVSEESTQISDAIGWREGELRLTPVFAHQIDISQDDDLSINAVVIHYVTEDNITNERTDWMRILTKTQDLLIKKNEVFARKENKLGEIPIVWLNNDGTNETFWGTGIGRPLVSANLTINEYLAQERLLVQYQTQSVTILQDMQEPEGGLSIFPGSYTHIYSESPDVKGDIRQLSPQAQISSIIEARKDVMKLITTMLDIPAAILDAYQTNSSLAVIENRDSLRRHYIRRQLVLRKFERNFFQMAAKIVANEGSMIFNQVNKVKVEIKFEPWATNKNDTINEWNLKLGTGKAAFGISPYSPIEMRMKVDGVSREEAMKLDQENTEKQLALLKKVVEVTGGGQQQGLGADTGPASQ